MRRKLLFGLLVTLLLALTLFVSQPVLAATCTSNGTGSWNASGTWSCGHVPVDGDAVIIASTHTVTVTNTASLSGLTVNGTLTVGDSSTAGAITVNGDVAIANTGLITTTNVSATHAMTITGNLTNDGTFNGSPSSGRIINVTFNKNGNQTVSGIGTTQFYSITLNMGTSNANVLDVQSVISMTSGGLTLNNGTFKLSSASTITPCVGSKTIGSSAGFYLNHAGAVSNWGSSGSLTVNGVLTITNGTMTVGSGSGNELEVNGSSASVALSGGTLNVAGRVRNRLCVIGTEP
ncbi:MAG: hypothetical protein FJ009_14915 [Chloroflexi bacterium]|nr:hypothetical protein [Chloroflexota bacterium]